MGLLDSLYFDDPSNSVGGLFSRLMPSATTQIGQTNGFDQASNGSGLFDSAMFNPTTFAPSAPPPGGTPFYGQQQNVAVGNYQMPVFGQPDANSAALPQNAQPTAGQVPQPAPQAGQPSMLDQLPSFLQGAGDRLSAGFQGFTNAGSPMQAIGNLVGGLTTGQRTDAQGMLQQQQRATFQSLVHSGVPPSTAMAAALNPEILKTIAPAYFDTKPQLQETGQDPMTGQKTFGVYRPNQGTLTPLNGGDQPSGGGSTASGGSLANFQRAIQQGVSGADLYQHLPPGMAQTVKSMIEGRMPPPSTVAMRSPATMALINAANAIDPNFDATTWKARSTFNQQLGSQQPNSVGGQRTLMNTSLGHLSELAETAASLGNWNTPVAALGHAANYVTGQGTEQAAKINKLNEQAARFSGEVGKLYSGSSGGGVHEREETANRFGGYKTSAELAAALEASRDLIKSKLAALEDQRNQIYGPDSSNKFDFLGDSGREALKKIDESIEKLRGNEKSNSSGPAAPTTKLKPGESTSIGGVTIKRID
ncbi:MAG: hypothetical protein J0G33_02650 [Afipia felis]|nr:hypothetical protein [Afipia felis]